MMGSLCSKCTRFNTERLDAEVCEAFPEGIPLDVLSGERVHTEPVEGDNGLMFQPLPGFEWLSEAKTEK